MVFRSSEGMTERGMKRERMLWERSENERSDQDVCQSLGSSGMCVGIYKLDSVRNELYLLQDQAETHPPLGARPVNTA